MKGVIWLVTGLLLALLLVSGINLSDRLPLPDNFFVVQDLKFINQSATQVLARINQSFYSQFVFLNNTATIVSTGQVITDWLSLLANWFSDLWSRLNDFLKSFLGSKSTTPTTMNDQELVDVSLLPDELGGTRYGIMVAPATGSTTRDEWLKRSLSRMFADRVNLKFDETGMSGVVTPVWQDGRQGHDYIFVLTPLR